MLPILSNYETVDIPLFRFEPTNKNPIPNRREQPKETSSTTTTNAISKNTPSEMRMDVLSQCLPTSANQGKYIT